MSAHRHVLDALEENRRLTQDLSALIEESMLTHHSVALDLSQLRHLMALTMMVATHAGRAEVALTHPDRRGMFHVELPSNEEMSARARSLDQRNNGLYGFNPPKA